MVTRHFGTLCAAFAVLSLAWQAVAEPWTVPAMDELADDVWGRTVRLGRDLTIATPQLIGPEVANPARRFAGNNLSCQSCHLAAGTAKFALPFVGVFGDFPQYRAREGLIRTLEDRVNGCMVRSMNGRELPLDGPEMQAIVAYTKFLSTGIPIGVAMRGRGTAEVPLLDRAADPARGATVYTQVCVPCHGADGAGKRSGPAGDAKGYRFPPLWGPDSFNDGAGMARLITLVGFVRGNMPQGTTWEKPALAVEEAWDVAAFVESQSRPHMDNLERDYPDRLQKPVDAAYGPYPDQFGRDQHRFGPFEPIKDAVRRLRATKTSQPADPIAPAEPTKR